MGRLPSNGFLAANESVMEAPVDVERRSFLKAGLSLSLMALWEIEPVWAKENNMVGNTKRNNALPAALTFEDVRSVSPALEHYTKGALLDGAWKRPGLMPRDRSVVTVAALIARIQTIEMPHQFALALDNGVTPAELSEIITHLAFYAGWANAMSAVAVARDIFHHRGIRAEQLPPAKEKRLPLDEESEERRATQVNNNFRAVSPGLVQNTSDLLFRDLWLRPALAPRDRSLVTVSALVANGQTGQISYHLGRALDNGLTREQASEVLTQVAFYAGWPCAFSALPVVKEVLEKGKSGSAQGARATVTSSTNVAGGLVISRAGSRPVTLGSPKFFTGSAQVEELFSADPPSRVSGGIVTFASGSRGAWHTHPFGQILVITAGVGRVQREGGPIQEVHAGDIVRIGPQVKHWHGAAPDAPMTHIAIQDNLDGLAVKWLEHVTDEQYDGRK